MVRILGLHAECGADPCLEEIANEVNAAYSGYVSGSSLKALLYACMYVYRKMLP